MMLQTTQGLALHSHFQYQNFAVIYSLRSSYRASLRGIPISIQMEQELIVTLELYCVHVVKTCRLSS